MTHGTTFAYFKHKCRCEPCRQAGSTYRRAYEKLRQQRYKDNPTVSKIPHGNRSKYRYDGCRCRLCKAAQAHYAAGVRARRKEREHSSDVFAGV